MQATPTLEDATARLGHNATFVGILPALLVGVVLTVVVHPVVGLAVAVLLAVAWVLVVRARIASADARVLGDLQHTDLPPGSAPRMENLLEGLCVSSGVPEPSVSVVETASINALVAVSGDRIRIVVTRGLIDELDRLELEGVIANLLSRVRDGSAGYITLATALLGASSRTAKLLSSRLDDQWVVRTDLAAVDLTRYPPGLRAALDRMATVGTEVPGSPATCDALWLVPNPGPSGDAAHTDAQPLALRIAVLAEL